MSLPELRTIQSNWQAETVSGNRLRKAVLTFVDFHNKTGQKLTVDFWKEETYDMIKEAGELIAISKTYLN